LHEIKRAARDKIIAEMKRVVKKEGTLIFIDFQVFLPKKLYAHLIKAIEFIAGHFRYLQDYIEQGGLDEILKKNQLPEEKRDCFKNGLVTIIKTRNP
jgi:ubiquinone/menaquinone biosynthesis C-methylase UbiE